MQQPIEQFKRTYIAECYELLTDMEARLLALDENEPDLEELNAIFRCAHSIKGGAGAFGFDNITKFTHTLEALLDKVREEKILPTKNVVDALLKSIDIVNNLVQAAEKNTKLDDNYGEEVRIELDKLVGSKPIEGATRAEKQAEAAKNAAATKELAVFGISFIPETTIFSNGTDPFLLIRELRSLGKVDLFVSIDNIPSIEHINPEECYMSWNMVIETIQDESKIKEVFEFVETEAKISISHLAEVQIDANIEIPVEKPKMFELPVNNKPETKDNAHAAPSKAAEKKATSNITSIRVDIEKIDKLVNMVGELVITQSMLYSQSKFLPLELHSLLIKGIEDLSQHSRELQEAVMSVRMQPVKSIFSRMNRIVRDLSNQLGKNIKLETMGENTEVDKTVIELLADPITHMIRNSIDHGIEKPDVRKAKGKPEAGTIKLLAYHRGGHIIIEIRDDGAGINRTRVLSKAKEKGLLSPDANLTDEEIDHLIFLPGFSTADVVSNISGRGVGMDVVRQNIESLGGKIIIQNVPEKGSIFTISLPLTLAILDGMIVRVGEENYIIPISNIIETIRPDKTEIKRIAYGSEVMNVRGDFIAVIKLANIFNIKQQQNDAMKDSLLILLENGNSKYGLVVDELVGQQQVVIKTLETNADPIDGISGATILGDGKVSLILDIAKLHTKLEDKGRVLSNVKAQ